MAKTQSDIAADIADQAKQLREEMELTTVLQYENQRIHVLCTLVEKLAEVVAVIAAPHDDEAERRLEKIEEDIRDLRRATADHAR